MKSNRIPVTRELVDDLMMPESPDFEKIADYWCFNEDTDDVPEMDVRRAEFVLVLKSIWNARGAADAEAVAVRIRELVAGEIVGAGIARHVAEAITKWDR